MRLVGQVRSSSGVASGENGRYLSNGIFFAVTFSGGIVGAFGSGWVGIDLQNDDAPCVGRGRRRVGGARR